MQTRIRISHDPPVFVYDTPGILTPNVPSTEVGMKLAACGMKNQIFKSFLILENKRVIFLACFQDHMVGMITIADFILYWLNRNYNYW